MTEPVAPIARRLLQWIIIAAIAIMVVFGLVPQLDVAVSSLFFDAQSGLFLLFSDVELHWWRDVILRIIVSISVLALLALLMRTLLPLRCPLIPSRAALFLVLTMALGPGLLVNTLLKEHWGRPRPIEVVPFKGSAEFVAWWDTDGACRHNCSFVSGDVATAAWTLAPAILLPLPWRLAAIGFAAVLTASFAAFRVMAGAHFLTDVTAAMLVSVFFVWLLHGLIYRWPETRSSEAAVDAGVVRLRDAWLAGLSRCAACSAAALHAIADLLRRLPQRWDAMRAGMQWRTDNGEETYLLSLWRQIRMPTVRIALDPDLVRGWRRLRGGKVEAGAGAGLIVTLASRADDSSADYPGTENPAQS